MSTQDKDLSGAAVRGEPVHPKWSVSKLGIATIGNGSIKLDGFTFYSTVDCQPKVSDVVRAVRDWIDGTLEQEILAYQEIEENSPEFVNFLGRSFRAADAPSEPSELPTTIRDGMHWPEGYVTDPNGKIIPPKGRYNDFNFGYNVGYAEGLQSIKDTVTNIGAQAVAKSRAADALDSQPTDLEALRRIARELRCYSPAGDAYHGAHIHKVWAGEIEKALATSQPTDGEVRNG